MDGLLSPATAWLRLRARLPTINPNCYAAVKSKPELIDKLQSSSHNTQMSFETPLPPFRASDPHATFLNSSCLDLLLIEMVPMAYRLAGELIVPVQDNLTSSDGEDQSSEAAFSRLDTLGHRVGQGLVER